MCASDNRDAIETIYCVGPVVGPDFPSLILDGLMGHQCLQPAPPFVTSIEHDSYLRKASRFPGATAIVEWAAVLEEGVTCLRWDEVIVDGVEEAEIPPSLAGVMVPRLSISSSYRSLVGFTAGFFRLEELDDTAIDGDVAVIERVDIRTSQREFA